jgi:hypothetical protein
VLVALGYHVIQCHSLLVSSVMSKYKEDFYFVDQVHGPTLHSSWCAACHKAHANFVESACLMADNFWNEGK